MGNIKTVRVADEPRIELHDKLSLTGCEVSVNNLPAHAEVPFVHYHVQNEEVYIILSGSGLVYMDGEYAEITQGDCFKVEPAVHRSLKAGAQGLRYLCIQCKEKSLTQFTLGDGKIAEGEKVNWPA